MFCDWGEFWVRERIGGLDEDVGSGEELEDYDLDGPLEAEMARMGNAREEIRKIAGAKQKSSKFQNEAAYNRRSEAQDCELQAGDTGWRAGAQMSRKTAARRLKPKRAGPYKVAEPTKTGVTDEKDGEIKHVAIAIGAYGGRRR